MDRPMEGTKPVSTTMGLPTLFGFAQLEMWPILQAQEIQSLEKRTYAGQLRIAKKSP